EPNAGQTKPAGDFARYLQPDRLVPVGGKTLELIKGKQLPDNQLAAARELYNIVDNHMKYKKVGTGWGRGDAVWACDNGYGNCTDFHSLFISLARSRKIPAKFVIGFPLPTNAHAGPIPGYHCWAWFHPQGYGWIPVDISEANKDPKMRTYYFGNLTPDRVAFSTGRDIELTPKQDGPALNYFVYPYVEVQGKPYPQTRVKPRFSFKDMAEKGS
ncbi:MAG TPA: transglutaminase-like domain-containing protein, partial [Gemmataceae bacterium]|nr:transglutaminase-like domain-containing protein [Gemmataceae bacterium]